MTTTIRNVRVFDGSQVLDGQTVEIDGPRIVSVRSSMGNHMKRSLATDIVDGSGKTLLPGLIDAHTHTSPEALRLALTFGVTTELEMGGVLTAGKRADLETDDAVADVRSSGFGITPPGGHPFEIIPEGAIPGEDQPGWADTVIPLSNTPSEAAAFIPRLIDSGSDYIKFLLEDGTVVDAPGLPMLDQETLDAGVREAHRRGTLTVAHTLSIKATRMAVQAGIGGLVHLFVDEKPTADIVDLVSASGAFVVPCLVLNSSILGITASEFAEDERVRSRLSPEWLTTLQGAMGHYPQGVFDDALTAVKAFHDAGVPILVGTDASIPNPALGGVAHGASVHHELQMLVRAGLSPAEALTAATSRPAHHFSLTDRGRISPGMRADLLLVEGDPTVDISDSLNIRAIWRRGTRVT